MTDFPRQFFGLATRTRLAQMLMDTYAAARNVDVDEAFARLESAFREIRLIEGVQQATWRALTRQHPAAESAALLERIERKLEKRVRFKAYKPKRAEEGPWAALLVAIDLAAGVGSGEGMDLLETPEGEKLLRRGYEVAASFLAGEMIKIPK